MRAAALGRGCCTDMGHCCGLLTGLRLLVQFRTGGAQLCLQISDLETPVGYFQEYVKRTYLKYRTVPAGAFSTCLQETFTDSIGDVWDCDSREDDTEIHAGCPPTGALDVSIDHIEEDWNNEIVFEDYWGTDRTKALADAAGNAWGWFSPSDPDYAVYSFPSAVADYPAYGLTGFYHTEASAAYDASYAVSQMRWQVENDGPIPVTIHWEEAEYNEFGFEIAGSRSAHSLTVPAFGSTGWNELAVPEPTHRAIDWTPDPEGDNGFLSRTIENVTMYPAGIGYVP
jgi:hypothetical protein